MTRSRDFIRGLSASWVATLVNVGYSFLSVPLALRYLSVDEFGLFVIVLQVAGYFALIDLGMSGATARILIDHTERRNSGAYGSIILTGGAVFVVQSCLLMALAIPAAPYLVALLAIPPDLEPVAVYLLRWLATAFAIGTVMRVFNSVLYANRRIDLVNLLMSLVPLAGLLLTFVVLAGGGGLWWLPAAFVPPAILAGAATGLASWRLGLLPRKGEWGRPQWMRFGEMFALGRDIFMINVGAQVLDASQILIVTRTVGLTAAAMWSVNTKLFTLVFQLATKIEGTAVVIFSEMIARDESAQLKKRFRQVYQLMAGTTVAALALCIGINQSFVSLWAGRELAWPPFCSVLLAFLVFANAVTRCHVDLIINTKQIGGLRYVYLFEAGVFVVASLWAGRHAGIPGVITASLICALLFRGTYTSHRTAAFFGVSWMTVSAQWLKNAITAGALLGPAAFFLARTLPQAHANNWIIFFLSAGAFSIIVVSGSWALALPRDVKSELLRKLPNNLKSQAGTTSP